MNVPSFLVRSVRQCQQMIDRGKNRRAHGFLELVSGYVRVTSFPFDTARSWSWLSWSPKIRIIF